MATSAAAAAGAVAARARREVRGRFEEQKAFDPNHAVAYDPPSAIHRRQFDQLIRRGILHETGSGNYWIDRDAERREAERQRAAAILLLKIIAIAAALTIAIVAIASRTPCAAVATFRGESD
jgi:hypothetical protein